MTTQNVITEVHPEHDGLVLITCSHSNTIGLDCWAPGFVMPKVGEEVVLVYQDKAKNFVSEVIVAGRTHNQFAPRAPRPKDAPMTTQPKTVAELREIVVAAVLKEQGGSKAFFANLDELCRRAEKAEAEVARLQAIVDRVKEATK